ncbi:hypothetical protein CMI42_05865 [Candidatus Pacearchaeota archaeon]|nr:hypothetical protein [Candidatus Pacearchaeota archaeon]|tara:strand:- start:3140 stop:3445 length:306 start_codon:yes stop_codon:yes gene_type:complete
MKVRKLLDVLHLTFLLLTIIFGLFILYQVILKILGGSWTTEAVIISLLTILISVVFTIAVHQVRFGADYNYFKRNMNHFSKDFKEFRKDISNELKEIKSKL